MDRKSLLVCATPRSGSYLLSDCLLRAGLPYADEWLTPFHLSNRKRTYGKREDLPLPELLKLLIRNESRDGIFAMKIMFRQMEELLSALRHLYLDESTTAVDLLDRVFSGLRFVRVHRGDKLAQAVSLAKARQDGSWVVRTDRERASGDSVGNARYSYFAVWQAYVNLLNAEKRWDRFFAESDVRPVVVRYEDLAANRRTEVTRIFGELGLPLPLGRLEKRTGVVRASSRLKSDWRSMFEGDLSRACEMDDINWAERDGAVRSLQIEEFSLSDSCGVGERPVFTARVRQRHGGPVDPVGSKRGPGWLRVCGHVERGDQRTAFEQEIRAAGDADGFFVAEGVLPRIETRGNWTVRAWISASAIPAEANPPAEFSETRIEAVFAPAREAARALFPDTVDLPDSWQYLDWFGYFLDDKFPWVYHRDHEWLFIEGVDEATGNIRIFDANIGWLWTTPESYPEVTLVDSRETWIFLSRQGDLRQFKSIADGRIRTFSTNKPADLGAFDSAKQGAGRSGSSS